MLPDEPESTTKSVLLWVTTVGGPLVVGAAFLYGFAMLIVSWLLASFK